MLAHRDEYGLVTRLSREHNVSRPTLYAWRERAEQALLAAFTPATPTPPDPVALERQVLTLLVHAHASERGIQTCLRCLTQQGISLASISAILHDAQQRALTWMQTAVPPSVRALALDEIYARDRRGAYLNAVDVHSGAVWASAGPLAVDSDSWTLLLWQLQERKLRWDRVVLDGGAAMHAACERVTPDLSVQSDQWHLLQSCSRVQARLERWLRDLTAQTKVVARQAARIAAGQRARGRRPKTDLTAHAQDVAAAKQVTQALRYLMHELHRLLEVVVLDRRGVLSAGQRQQELEVLLTLLAELASAAPALQQTQLWELHAKLRDILPQVLTFVPQVERVQHDLSSVLVPAQQALLGWAWLRRKSMGWTSADILLAVPADWRAAGRLLLHSWDDAVRVSSAVERWHSILRPHVAVHRTLSSGMLAILAVWHNHRVFSRAVNKGKSPLHLSGMSDAPSDWLVALGYPPAAASIQPRQPTAPALALAA
jgi:transposase-like protein